MVKTLRFAWGPAAMALGIVGAATAAYSAEPSPTFADLADLTIAAPVIVHAVITDVERIGDKDSPGLAPGRARLLVTARLDAALVAPSAVPAALSWLWDAPLDARGKAPKPKGQPIIAWTAVPAADGKTRLVAGAAQMPWDATTEARVRAIATEARSGTVPAINGVANGFRVDGTIPGESESQFFLTASDGARLTMIVTTKPGEIRRVAISRGDVIDESAAMVRPETLLQYRLACFLPAALPPAAGGDDTALAADWRAALAAIGPCGRTL
jgi:hypothetical protein